MDASVSVTTLTKMYRLHSSCSPHTLTVTQTDWKTYSIVKIQPSSCQDLYTCGQKTSGVYTIYPWERSDPNYRPVQVYCDMETDGGGWTAIQRRVNGGKSFKQNWVDYKIGFGSPHEDYWIGNDVIHQLTKGTNSSLYVEISPRRDNYTFYQVYRDFSISSEDQKYKLANPGNGCN
ncbi:ficolin-2-like [Crassostrea angulata]|uniref:ficolin-2-like n=1 Tax=Magallana angulata TaxID=2784310 RepID=UPI0022B1D1BD|nr:ficolin-2-like [Crassostrea angulata]